MKRLPTKEEFEELITKCKWVGTTFNNLKGCIVTGLNGNSIFLPVAGYHFGKDLYYASSYGFYWSSSRSVSKFTSSYYLNVGLHNQTLGFRAQNCGLSVRLVSDTEGVDLGLSIKWLPCNEGANKPEEYGNYYTYNEAMKLFNQNKNTDNIFENAHFNKLYKTKDGRKATFIGWDDMMQHAILYVKERDMEFYGEATYELDGTTLGGSTPHDIISEWNMENTITINVPSGKIAQQTTDGNGNILIKFIDPEPIRSKSWEEFCRNHPNTEYKYFINQHGGIDFRTSGPRNTINNLATAEDAKGILALIQLTRLHDEWIGNWKPDYSVHGNTKYAIVIQSNKIQITEWIALQSLLEFPTREMAKEFLDCFVDLISKAKKFI